MKTSEPNQQTFDNILKDITGMTPGDSAKHKLSSYQKLKMENLKLKQDIYQLVMNPDGLIANMIAAGWRHEFGFAKMALYGERKSDPSKPFGWYEMKEPGDYAYSVTHERPVKPWFKRLWNKIRELYDRSKRNNDIPH